jgi:hypothetical protein
MTTVLVNYSAVRTTSFRFPGGSFIFSPVNLGLLSPPLHSPLSVRRTTARSLEGGDVRSRANGKNIYVPPGEIRAPLRKEGGGKSERKRRGARECVKKEE